MLNLTEFLSKEELLEIHLTVFIDHYNLNIPVRVELNRISAHILLAYFQDVRGDKLWQIVEENKSHSRTPFSHEKNKNTKYFCSDK